MSTPEDIRLSTPGDIRETVRQRYAEAATRSAAADLERARSVETTCCGGASVAGTDQKTLAVETTCCGEAPVATTDAQGREVFGAELYGPDAAQGAPGAAVAASLGCGVPTAVADLHPGEVVLDLGSGAGADEGMDETTKADMTEWTGCIAGALTQTEFAGALTDAGFTDIEIRPTHRVHTHAQAAIIRATH